MIVSLVASSEHRAGSGIISNGKDEDKKLCDFCKFDFVNGSSGKFLSYGVELYVGYRYVVPS